MKKKRYLVTGGSGFIGSNICKLLVKMNQSVVVYDNNSRHGVKNLKSIMSKIVFIKGDIRDKKKLFTACKNIDSVIHLAYINGTKFFYSKPELVLDVATKGTINIFDACIKYKIKEFFLASSSEVYQTPLKTPTDENESLKVPDVHNPRYTYGGGKILSELYAINYGRKFFKKMIIFRPHNVYGPNMGNEHVIPELIKKFRRIKKNIVKIQGTGKEIRTFIHIDDFVSAFNLLVKKGKHLNIYNIGTSEKIQIKQLVTKISKIFNKKIKVSKTSLQKGGTKIRIPDISKIKRLGFKPKFNLNKGLREILKK